MVEYLKDHNATQAYIRAGYKATPEAARRNASRLLTNADVMSEIARLEAEQLAKVQEETGITLERTVREIAKVAFHDPRKFWHEDGRLKAPTELDDDAAAALQGFEVDEIFQGGGEARTHIGDTKKIKLAGKAPYLDMLMKHLGGFEKDNRQKDATMADVARQFFGALHAGSGRVQPVREAGRAKLPPSSPLVKP